MNVGLDMLSIVGLVIAFAYLGSESVQRIGIPPSLCRLWGR
jgi:hypothetical protein